MKTHLLYPRLGEDYPVAVRAEGSYVHDADGNAYLDGCSGAIVVNLGHGVPEIAAAIRAQAEEITFVTRLQFTNEPAERLAAELALLAPGELDHVFFTNSGSEAVEAALRLALQYWQERGRPERTVVVSRDGSYHGATLGAIGLSGHPARRRPVRALLPDWPRAAAANCRACPFGLTPSSCGLECAQSIEDAILGAGADRVAAVVIEPVVGASGGAVPAPPGYLREVARICRRHDVLLIADEVITGLGRTGQWFGCGEEDVEPDLLVLGKGLSAGYAPLGAVLLTGRIHEAIRTGSGQFVLGHTYAANPLSAAVGLAVLRYTREHDLPARARVLGPLLAGALGEVLRDRGVDAEVRGRGLLLAVDFGRPGRAPDITAADVVREARNAGLLLYPAGVTPVPQVVVVAPPLTISPVDLDHLVTRFATALDAVLTHGPAVLEGAP
ncbi:aminotransferase class III-fold pyridoxal phosphate-dependent enzyme [Amycolatopsis sp. A133]|uniref:aminotransferase class III-fold pyridoxal phosphate-dependent enzyme n=1 Tax=Amycolatopsis sp. A133 TaxID=3064472 RepID=UPI0027EEEF74|nr:aminotransferase class III-fold pyridoxal phosphate-dependent enzyme [Amycolatopsis sp. A133]MDQ7808737.1 aminotransferase class III-fold pyridoxal phosphate-dependent enzyme [Amycolatopsis sp. A133]